MPSDHAPEQHSSKDPGPPSSSLQKKSEKKKIKKDKGSRTQSKQQGGKGGNSGPAAKPHGWEPEPASDPQPINPAHVM